MLENGPTKQISNIYLLETSRKMLKGGNISKTHDWWEIRQWREGQTMLNVVSSSKMQAFIINPEYIANFSA